MRSILPILIFAIVGCGLVKPPKPSNFVEPEKSQLERSIKAFKSLGASFEQWDGDPQVDNLPVFRMPANTDDKTLELIPIVPFSFGLDISNSKVTDVGVQTLTKQENLWLLNMSHTEVTDDSCAIIAECENVSSLYLIGTDISDEGVKSLVQLQNLRLLSLFSTDVTDVGLKDVSTLTNLKCLDLAGTQISDDALNEIAKLKELSQLYIGHTHVTPYGANRIRKTLTGCNVEHQ